MFGGKAMTYYGRWTYKYEIGGEAGRGGGDHHPRDRSGRLSVPGACRESAASASTSITPDKNMGRAAVEGWMTRDQAGEAVPVAPARTSIR